MRSERGRRVHYLVALACVVAAVFLLAWLGIRLTRENDRIAAVWLANGVTLAALLVHDRQRWPQFLFAAFAANVAANLASGDAPTFAGGLALANQVEVLLAAAIVHPVFCQSRRIDDSIVIVRLLVGVACGCTISAALAAAIVALTAAASFAAVFGNWLVSDLLGLLIVTPLLLAARGLDRTPSWRSTGEFVVLLAGATAAAEWVFWQTSQPLLFTLALVVFFVALRLGLFAAMSVVCAITTVGLVATLSGHGIIAAANVDATERMYVFQLFVAVQLFSVLPIRALISERDQLGQAAAESDRLFRRIAEASPAGILHLDAGGRPTFVNARWTDLTGFTFARLCGDAWLDVIDRRTRSAARSLWAKARATDTPVSGEFAYDRSDGGKGWAELSIYPEVHGLRLLGFVVRLTDITARKESEEALSEREMLYRVVTENAQDVVVRLSADGTVLYASSALSRLFGIDPASLIGRHFSTIILRDDWAEILCLTSPDVGLSVPVTRFRVRHGDGRSRWTEVSFRHLMDGETGELHETVVSMRDIDARRANELKAIEVAGKLRERNRLLEMAEDLAEVGHWRFDFDTSALDCSRHTRLIAGLGSGTASIATILANVIPEDRRGLLKLLVRGRRGEGRLTGAIRVNSAKGVRHIRLGIQPDLDANGAVIGLFGVVRDKSEFIAAQQQLIQARDDAQAAARAKSHFLATMSHEIRTPMTGVLGMIDLLRDEPDGTARDQYFSTLKQSADLLMTVLDDVLDFSKIDSGALRLETSSFDLRQLVGSTVDMFSNAASRKGILLTFDCTGTDQGVVSDPIRIQQVVSNLLSNAIKFTGRGQVTVTLSSSALGSDRRQWAIEVRDTGIGIAPDAIGDIFEPFVQAESNTSRRFGGTGLGLAISRRLAEAMGGRLSLTSRLGEGSCFRFDINLPVAKLGVEPARPSQQTGPSSASALRLLVAEDNPVNQLLIGALLGRLGHHVTIVDNGLKAVDAARAGHFDAILMDMQMPEMDGLAATRAIRASGRSGASIPIVALTADASPERRRFYDGVGLTDFMTKPIDAEQLANLLARLATNVDHAEQTDGGRADQTG